MRDDVADIDVLLSAVQNSLKKALQQTWTPPHSPIPPEIIDGLIAAIERYPGSQTLSSQG